MPGYGTPLSLTLPVIGGTEAAAAVSINTALAALIARLESKVGAADLDLNADVSLKSGTTYSGLTDAQRVAFRDQTAAITAASNPATVYVLNGDLHYIDAAGNLVQITADGAVNVSTTGGITGAGYGTAGVEVNWDSVNSRYRLRSGSDTDDYADAALADVLFNDGSGNFARLQAPALSGDYTLSLLSALPASTSLLQVTAAGLMQATTAPTLTGLTVNGTAAATAVTASTTVTATGDVVAGGHLRVSGTGRYKYEGDFLYIPAAAMTGADDTNLASGYRVFDSFAGTGVQAPLMRFGDNMQLVAVTVFANKLGGAGNRDLDLCSINAATGAVTVHQTLTSTATGLGTVTYNFANLTLTAPGFFLRYSGEVGDRVYEIVVEFNR